jgi:hypothetical protein
MSQEQAVEITLTIEVGGRRHVESWRIYAPPSVITNVRDSAASWFALFCQKGAARATVGSPGRKPPA